MPIKFRCPHCQQFLGISRSRAGAVTDCPMCGRSIRVPLLDGSVEPLPEPELNLQDHGLASALDKLASLVSRESAEAVAEQPAPAAGPIRSVIATAPQPIPLPEPIVLSPAPAPVVAESPAGRSESIANSSPARTADPLSALAAHAPPEGSPARARPLRDPLSGAILAAGVAVIALAAFGFGYFVGLRSVPPAASTAVVVPTNPAAEPAQDLPAAVLAAEPALTGRIQYIDTAGETRPDAGARVLVLPEERSGSAKLSADGFRAGAAAGDLRLALGSVRAIGGDFAIATADGSYTLSVPAAGLYQLVILSRYQPRPETEPMDAAALQFLGQYFDRPAQVIGDAALHSSQFRYRGSGATQRDHSFEAP
jgi:hypothetical protein